MKKISILILALLAVLLMGGNDMLSIIPTASAQRVKKSRTQRKTAIVRASENSSLATLPEAQDSINRRVDETRAADELNAVTRTDSLDLPRIDSAFLANLKSYIMDPGILRRKTATPAKKRFESKVVKWAGRDRYERYTEQCAAHVNGRLKSVGYYSQGHAYQIPYFFPSVINGYNSVEVPNISKMSWEDGFHAVLNMHRQASDYIKEHLDTSVLVPGAYYIVNMYYTTSPYMLKFFHAAKKQGTGNYGTHVGLLYYDAEYETWVVEHNIHGHVHYDALESILGGKSNPHKYGVTSISKVSK
jgi:hypothetical protein